MSITLNLARLADFCAENPWPTVALVFLFGVVLPAVWSTRRHRRLAAAEALQAFLNAAAAVASFHRVPDAVPVSEFEDVPHRKRPGR